MPGRLTLDPPTGKIDPTATRGADNPGTSRANVAQVAAAALADPSTIGRIYRSPTATSRSPRRSPAEAAPGS